VVGPVTVGGLSRRLVIVGPTATGKSAIAMELARRHPAFELVSVDSMQVYRRMDIGTAKPTSAEQAAVRHHMIDLIEPADEMSIVEFSAMYRDVLLDISERNQEALLVGGTGLYVRAVVDGLTPPPQFPEVVADLEAESDTAVLHRRLAELDPVAAGRMEASNRRRVVRALSVTIGAGRGFSSFGPGLNHYPDVPEHLVGIDMARPLLDQRISDRYNQQMDEGLLDEVRSLLEAPGGLGRTSRQALGYKELIEHVEGRLTIGEALDLAKARTRKFARRQQSWFRRDPRLTWIVHDGDITSAVGEVMALLEPQ